jgi:hypothetical protein
MEEEEVDRARSTLVKPKGTWPVKVIVDGRIILKWILKIMFTVWIGFICFSIGISTELLWTSYRTSRLYKKLGILWLADNSQFLKKDFAPWSYLIMFSWLLGFATVKLIFNFCHCYLCVFWSHDMCAYGFWYGSFANIQVLILLSSVVPLP